MVQQHQPFLMTSLKSLQSQHMYDSLSHVSFIYSNREIVREERGRERETVFCAFDSTFTVTLPLFKLQSSGHIL